MNRRLKDKKYKENHEKWQKIFKEEKELKEAFEEKTGKKVRKASRSSKMAGSTYVSMLGDDPWAYYELPVIIATCVDYELLLKKGVKEKDVIIEDSVYYVLDNRIVPTKDDW